MTVQYQCEGCGEGVMNFVVDSIPPHGFCSTCHWLDLHMKGDLKEFWEVYDRIEVTRRDPCKGSATTAS
jgi:hypothetical protein